MHSINFAPDCTYLKLHRKTTLRVGLAKKIALVHFYLHGSIREVRGLEGDVDVEVPQLSCGKQLRW